MEKMINGFSETRVVKCYCNECAKNINHTILKSIKTDWDDLYNGVTIDGYDDYQILQCIGCNTIIFRIDGYFSEYVDYLPDGSGGDGTYEKLFPPSTRYDHNLKKYEHLPYNLKNVYEEAVSLFNQSLYILCSVGIRSILDGICIEQKIKKGKVDFKNKDGTIIQKESFKLDGKINGLNEHGIITKAQMKALHELRFLGNKAIHELEIPLKPDLESAIDIIEHMLIDIYELPAKSEKLKSRREKT